MISKVPFIIVLLASMVLISSAIEASLPSNYTWPLDTKHLCFAGRFNLVLNVDYTKIDDSRASVSIPLNSTTYVSYSVSCVPTVHQLKISMLNNLTTIIFDFSLDVEKNTTLLTKVHGYLTVDETQKFIEYSNTTAGTHVFSSNETLFDAGRGNSYECNTKTQIKGFESNKVVVITSIDLENIRIQPFLDDSKEFNDFDEPKVCSADDDKTSNLIPIIVGACLAVLIVVVLVAYLIGRRRNRNGYQSV